MADVDVWVDVSFTKNYIFALLGEPLVDEINWSVFMNFYWLEILQLLNKQG